MSEKPLESLQDLATGLITEKYDNPDGPRFLYVIKTENGMELTQTTSLGDVAAFVAGYRACLKEGCVPVKQPTYDHPCVEGYDDEGIVDCDDYTGASCLHLQRGGTWENCDSGGLSWAGQNLDQISPKSTENPHG